MYADVYSRHSCEGFARGFGVSVFGVWRLNSLWFWRTLFFVTGRVLVADGFELDRLSMCGTFLWQVNGSEAGMVGRVGRLVGMRQTSKVMVVSYC
jgi:hypothetical protein